MAEEKAAAIEIQGVGKKFGAVVALQDVSFSVQPGELFFLLGPSGCGKSTLLRILAGLEKPDAGKIFFDGKDIADLPPHERGAPMVFQNYALWPHLNIKENVAFGLVERKMPKGEIETRVADVLHKVELEGLQDRMPGQLSGGQQQRVVLARALVLNPKIVLLDEPLSNLDAKLRIEMREEIEKLHNNTNITFVYVTHDQAEALSLADRMAVLNKGQIHALGVPRELYYRPPNAFCADFLGEANLIAGEVVAVDPEGLQVKTLLGLWHAVNPAGSRLPLGAAIRCMVRPESLQLMPKRQTGFNGFEAEIRSLRMSGSTVTLSLTANGVALKATILNHSDLDLKPGMKVGWGTAVGNTVVIAKD
jgi:iron(III) transport system ATP-binding protein